VNTSDTLRAELQQALGGFARYMNRPLARVHVFTWRLSCKLEPENSIAPGGLRLLPPYRAPSVKAWRVEVARFIKTARRSGRITLPCYVESSAEYVGQVPPAASAVVYCGPCYGRVHKVLAQVGDVVWVQFHGRRFIAPVSNVEYIFETP
jgi:hypothetical protein